MKTLVIGYGNPGRGDDGLGPALAEAVEALGLGGVSVEVDFQLNVEDAYALEGYDAAVFADAAVKGEEPFYFKALDAQDEASFSSHSVSPAGLMALASKLFGIHTKGYVLGIRGYEFDEFGAPLTQRAQSNLGAAIAFLEPRLRAGDPGVEAPA